MRLLHPGGEFWSGTVAGKAVVATWSKRGRESRQTTPFKTPAAARKAFAALVKKLEGLGYRREVPPEVLDALAAHPRDEAALAVLADALQGAGDLRGELAALVVSRKDADLARFLERHGAQLFGPALADVEGEHLTDLTWTPGFLFGLTVDSEAQDPVSLVELLQRLSRAPVASLLREVRLLPGDEPWSRAVAELTRLPHPEVLSSLRLDASALDLSQVDLDAGDFTGSWSAFPGLRALWLAGTRFELGELALPRLRLLSLLGGGFGAAELQAVAALPALEHLELGSRPTGFEELRELPAALRPGLDALLRRPLRTLCLRHLELSAALLETLFDSPAFRALRTLDLGDCEVDQEAAEFLLDEAAALKRLEAFSSPTFALEDEERFADDEAEERPRGEAVLRGKNVVEDAWAQAVER